jgi:hypothetical protein
LYITGSAFDLLPPELLPTWMAELDIGFHMIPHGFLSREWITALGNLGCTHPHRKLAKLVYTIWIDFTDSIWCKWNTLTHDKLNLNDHAREQVVDQRLLWYLQNYRMALSPNDYCLLTSITHDNLELLPFRTKQQ